MKVVVLLIVPLICLGTASPLDELLSKGELVQGLLRNIKPEDFEKFGIDTSAFNGASRIIADGLLTVPQLLKKYDYPSEVHKVQTGDGYILEMHRIPKPGATPVFLMHGLLDSSGGWVIAGPHSAFAYYLSDLGYDVWMGNARGNRYSREHAYLNPERKEFWDFSFHEIGSIDVPAMIDYVLDKTGFEKIHYISHAQGSMAFFIMCDQRPGYCDKVKSLNALAPIAYLRHVKSPLLIALSYFPLDFWANLLGFYEFAPNSEIFKLAGQVLCKKEAITQPLCYNILFLITGFDSQELNKTMLPAIFGHVPDSTSTKTIVHYSQLTRTNNFRMFDFGFLKNYDKYGSIVPPSYDLAKTTVPTALHYSMNDWMADTKDVFKLSEKLPNLLGHYIVPLPKFNHLDFLFGISSRKLVYDEVVKVLKSIDSQQN